MKKKINIFCSYEQAIEIVCLAIMAYLICIICSGAYYTVLYDDDFSHACTYLLVDFFEMPNEYPFEHLIRSLLYARGIWLFWQGTYFSMFIQALLCPLNGSGMTQLRIVMVLNAFLILVTFLVFVYIMLHEVFKKNDMIFLVICMSILWIFTNSKEYTEIYNWYSGATSYSIPLICLFCSLILYFLFAKYNKRIYFVLSIIFGFCAMGGSLCVAAAGCFILLIILIGFFLENKIISSRLLCVFICYMSGAVLNVSARGNFIRHASYGEDLRIFDAMSETVKFYYGEIQWLFTKTPMLLLAVVFVVLGINLSSQMKIRVKSYLFCSVCMLVIPIVISYPVVLAYNGIEYFPNRCQFVVDLFLEFSVWNFFLAIGCAYNIYYNEKLTKKLLVYVITIAVVIVSCGQRENYSRIINEYRESISSGSLATYYKECVTLYDYLENSTENEIILDGYPEKIDFFGGIYISQDKNHWVNQAIATWYDKDSIVVIGK